MLEDKEMLCMEALIWIEEVMAGKAVSIGDNAKGAERYPAARLTQ